jgi:hypothetical protein
VHPALTWRIADLPYAARPFLHAQPAPALQSGDKWTVQLEGAEQAVNLPDLLLHATQEADWDRAFAPAQAQRVEEALALEDIVSWVRAYCSQPDKPVRLVRHLPHAHLWFTVLSKQRDISRLSDEEVASLKYMMKGGWVGGWVGGCESKCIGADVAAVLHVPARLHALPLICPFMPPLTNLSRLALPRPTCRPRR